MALNEMMMTSMSDQMMRGLIVGISVGLELLVVITMVNLRLRETGMGLKQYITHRLDKEKRADEKNKPPVPRVPRVVVIRRNPTSRYARLPTSPRSHRARCEGRPVGYNR